MSSNDRYKIGQLINYRYEIRQIYRGGMGVVFLCQDKVENMPFALKTFQDEYLATPAAKERFIQEASDWIELGYHRHVVYAERVEKIDGKPYLVLECVLGPSGTPVTLSSRLQERPLDISETLKYLEQLCIGFTYIQSIKPGLIHRDIKPSNILISHDDLAKITDFGITTRQQEKDKFFQIKSILGIQSQSKTILGTYGYMSPEQERGEKLDLQSDIYALGLVFYEMLTRERYADAILRYSSQEKLLSSVGKTFGNDLKQILQKCLSPLPSDRYVNFEDLGLALDRLYTTIFHDSLQFEHRYQIIPGIWTVLQNLTFDRAVSSIKTYKSIGEITNLNDKYSLSSLEDKALTGNLLEQGDSLMELGKYSSALDNFERALADGLEILNNPDALTPQARKMLDTSFTPSSEKDKKSQVSSILVRKANALRSLGKTSLALETYQEALGYDDSNFNAWYNMGECLYNDLNDISGAINAYEKSLSIKEDDYMAWTSKGFVLSELERWAESMQCYDRALELNPRFVIALGNKGVLLLKLGDMEQAREYFVRITQVDPGMPLGWYYLATIVYVQDKNKGMEYFQQAQRLDPTISIPQFLWQVNINQSNKRK